MIGAWWAWLAAGVLYLLFRLWYDNWRGPLRADEIARFMTTLENSRDEKNTDLRDLRRFLEEDDGREFLMANLVRLRPEPQIHPHTGATVKAAELMQGYSKGFLATMVLLGGHPFIVTRKVGGYIDAWDAGTDPGWTIAAYMRYRSRRDCMRLATNPRFLAAHPLKVLAVANTISFPTTVLMSGTLRPRTAVALMLAFAAALVHLGSLLLA